MAIYHASFQIISRSSGRSSTAAAAYRHAIEIEDMRTGEKHDYTRKKGVDDSFIIAPQNAPDWAHDRKQLWNNVEQIEKRKDAQLSRELNVALPVELTQAQSKEVLINYIEKNFKQNGMIADVAMHDMKSENPHAHIMLTMRHIDQGGFGKKNRDWNKKENIETWRESWAFEVNRKLEELKIDQKIDHRSYERQGLEIAPTKHLGPQAHAMEKRGIKTEKGDYNREIKKLNLAFIEITKKVQELKKGVEKTIDKGLSAIEKIKQRSKESGVSAIEKMKERKQIKQEEIKKERTIKHSIKFNKEDGLSR